jgi:hypothetical protein
VARTVLMFVRSYVAVTNLLNPSTSAHAVLLCCAEHFHRSQTATGNIGQERRPGLIGADIVIKDVWNVKRRRQHQPPTPAPGNTLGPGPTAAVGAG